MGCIAGDAGKVWFTKHGHQLVKLQEAVAPVITSFLQSYVCMKIYKHTYMCVYIYTVYIYVCMYVCMHVCMYIYIYIYLVLSLYCNTSAAQHLRTY